MYKTVVFFKGNSTQLLLCSRIFATFRRSEGMNNRHAFPWVGFIPDYPVVDFVADYFDDIHRYEVVRYVEDDFAKESENCFRSITLDCPKYYKSENILKPLCDDVNLDFNALSSYSPILSFPQYISKHLKKQKPAKNFTLLNPNSDEYNKKPQYLERLVTEVSMNNTIMTTETFTTKLSYQAKAILSKTCIILPQLPIDCIVNLMHNCNNFISVRDPHVQICHAIHKRIVILHSANQETKRDFPGLNAYNYALTEVIQAKSHAPAIRRTET